MGAECLVLSVDYRLGPDWKFPTAANDAFDALHWVFAEAERLGADPARIALGGDSAGGTLAAASAVAARNAGLTPVLQLLIYPGTSARQDTPSHRALAEGYLLTADMIQWFFSHYLGQDADRDDWRFAPLDGGGTGADVRGCARPGSPWPATTPCMTKAWPTRPSSRRRGCRPRWSTIRR